MSSAFCDNAYSFSKDGDSRDPGEHAVGSEVQ